MTETSRPDDDLPDRLAEILCADAAALMSPAQADPADIERNLQDWVRMLKSLRRVIVTRPALVESMELQVQRAGIAGLVQVVGNPLCPPGQMYVMPDPDGQEGRAPA